MNEFIPSYINALAREIELIGWAAPQPVPVHTIFFGGGTPSLLTPQQVDLILRAIRTSFTVLVDPEITMEANPGTVTHQSLARYREAGVNRLSFGMQSAISEELALLERIHSIDEVHQAVQAARAAGFNNLNLDLIFGLPNQSMNSWKTSLDFALSLRTEHLSLYNLTIEEGTPLFQQVQNGHVIPIDDNLSADMFELAIDYLAQQGFLHYEISNWARQRSGELKECRHNLQYWRNLSYLGFGVGAHGFFDQQRMENTSLIADYIQRMGQDFINYPASPANTLVRKLPISEQMKDTMMLGLRLLDEGIQPQQFLLRYGVTVESIFGDELNELIELGLVENTDSIRLSTRGMMVGNQVFMRFVGD